MLVLTDRCYSIISYLLERKKEVTASELSKKFGVSERTIRYDLKIVESWLSDNNIVLMKKPRKGIWIDNVDKVYLNIKDKLNEFEGKHFQVYTAKERKNIILNILFQSDKPVHIKGLCEKLYISKTTLINDINAVEQWLKERDVELIRKPKFGIKLVADEVSWRKAVIDYVYENANQAQILKMLNNTNSMAINSMRISSLMDSHIKSLFKEIDIVELEKYLKMIEKKLNVKFVDTAFTGLLMHICLAISRLKKDEKIVMPKEQLATLENTAEFEHAKLITNKIEKKYSVKIPKAEIGYLTLHILGAKVRRDFLNESQEKDGDGSVEYIIVKEFIRKVSELLNCDLTSMKELESNLVLHIKPAIKRFKYNLKTYNPLLDEIKNRYLRIFNACEAASKIINFNLGITLDESEIGYLTMHVGAAMESLKRRSNLNKLKVLVVCSTGIGTSKMLSSRLRKEFHELDIYKEISLGDLDEELVNKVDIIISTISIDDYFIKPICVVSPLINKKDIEDIEAVINTYKKFKRKAKNDLTRLIDVVEQYCIIEDLEGLEKALKKYFNISEYSRKNHPRLSYFLNKKTVKVNVEVKNWRDSITECGQILLQKGTIENRYIESMIEVAEKYNSHFVFDNGVAIAHSKGTDGVNETSMSMIVLNKPVMFHNRSNIPVYIVVTLAAKDESKHVQALSQLSNIIRNRAAVDKIVKANTVKDIIDILNEA